MKWGAFPDEILERGDSRQIQELWLFEKLEPFGDEWRQSAQIVSAIYNTQTTGERFGPEVFMPLPPKDELNDFDDDDDEEVEQRSVEEIRASLEACGIPVVVKSDGNN